MEESQGITKELARARFTDEMLAEMRALIGTRAFWAIVIVSAFGLSDELHQHFTPGRSMEFMDWVADTLGATLAVGLYTYWAWYRKLLEAPLWSRRNSKLAEHSAQRP
jgi:hypothetical protein